MVLKNFSKHQTYNSTNKNDYFIMSIIYKNLLSWLKWYNNSQANPSDCISILDFGCSTGSLLSLVNSFYLKFYKNLTTKLVGIDVSTKLLESASQKVPSATFLLNPSSTINCEDNSFDIIISTQVLEHVPDPDATIKEFKRILKPRGLLYFACPNAASLGSWYKGRLWHSNPYVFPEHISILSFYDYRNLLIKHDLQILKDGTSGFGNSSNSGLYIRSSLSKIFLALFGTMLNWPCGESYYCAATKTSQ